MKIRSLTMAACTAVVLGLASQAMAQTPEKSSPKGAAVVDSVTMTATVTAIDHQTRAVTIKTTDGREYSFVASKAVKNLPQVKTGDIVTATYTEALVYEVKKGGKAGAESTVAGGSAAAGKMPAAAIGQQTTVTVLITAIDASAPSVTFKGPAGNSRTIKVRYPERLQGVSVGDTVDITYAESFAMSVKKAPKK